MNALLRPIKIDEHPVAKKRYRIPTPAIEQFYALVQRCIQLSIPGAIVYARTRFGKSSAIQSEPNRGRRFLTDGGFG